MSAEETNQNLNRGFVKKYRLYRENPGDTIWWVDNYDRIGEHLFTFDKVKIFNIFTDYPWNLTPEQKKIFDDENPFWADFLSGRDDR